MRRRDMLKTAALIGGAPLLHAAVDKREAGNQGLRRFEERLEALRVKTGLKIKRIETFTQGSVLSFVRVTCDDGSEGYDQISTYDADISAMILHRKLARLVLGAISNAGPHLELSIEKASWAENLYDPALVVRDGCVAIPDGPGWGVTLRPSWLEKATRQVS